MPEFYFFIIFYIVISVVIPYLVCGINSDVIAKKLTEGEYSRKTMAVALFFDMLKGIASIRLIILFLHIVFYDSVFCGCTEHYLQDTGRNAAFHFHTGFIYFCMWFGSMSGVLGHYYRGYSKSKGRRAVIVALAAGLVINWLAALIALSVFILMVLITRYVSLSTVVTAISYVFAVWLTELYVWNHGNSGLDYASIGTVFCGIIAVILILNQIGSIKGKLSHGKQKQ
ncbi:MAG: glycerol-3-phosphate acyltransferase [Oscillospiraceae bacterium]|nr:glycerol-3-phosphate acyltransferase [Oscillospiraceae bacterium]